MAQNHTRGLLAWIAPLLYMSETWVSSTFTCITLIIGGIVLWLSMLQRIKVWWIQVQCMLPCMFAEESLLRFSPVYLNLTTPTPVWTFVLLVLPTFTSDTTTVRAVPLPSTSFPPTPNPAWICLINPTHFYLRHNPLLSLLPVNPLLLHSNLSSVILSQNLPKQHFRKLSSHKEIVSKFVSFNNFKTCILVSLSFLPIMT